MQQFFPEIEVRDQEAEAIARGLYAIARADGEVHPKELALISEFFTGTSSHPAALAALERSDAITPEELASLLPAGQVRELFVKTALLMAYADNQYSSKESQVLIAYAKALGIDEKQVNALEDQVKDFLLSQLTHLKNVNAAAQVAKELKA